MTDAERAAVEPLTGWTETEPVGACGGGECEWDAGTWFPCMLHQRELGQVTPETP